MRYIFLLLLTVTSCASLRSEKELIETNVKNTENVYRSIKANDLAKALEYFEDGIYYDYASRAYLYIRDKEGLNTSFLLGDVPEHGFTKKKDTTILKNIVRDVSRLYSCTVMPVEKLENCLKEYVKSPNIKTGFSLNTNYEHKCKESKNDEYECNQLEGLSSVICGKDRVVEINDVKRKERGGPVMRYVFDTSYADHWRELQDIRRSSFCKDVK